MIAFEFPAVRTWQLGALRGNGVRPGMPGGAWQTQVAIGDLAFCARVLANAATGGVGHRGGASQEDVIRRSKMRFVAAASFQ